MILIHFRISVFCSWKLLFLFPKQLCSGILFPLYCFYIFITVWHPQESRGDTNILISYSGDCSARKQPRCLDSILPSSPMDQILPHRSWWGDKIHYSFCFKPCLQWNPKKIHHIAKLTNPHHFPIFDFNWVHKSKTSIFFPYSLWTTNGFSLNPFRGNIRVKMILKSWSTGKHLVLIYVSRTVNLLISTFPSFIFGSPSLFWVSGNPLVVIHNFNKSG